MARQGGSGTAAADLEHGESADPHNPSLEEPWEPGAADALVRLYESGDARTALQSPFNDEFRERLSQLTPPSSAGATPSDKVPLSG
ncbi:MAG TPA: hypothetical protein VF051_11865, partial [Hyphomicrobiaceae bacterium]